VFSQTSAHVQVSANMSCPSFCVSLRLQRTGLVQKLAALFIPKGMFFCCTQNSGLFLQSSWQTGLLSFEEAKPGLQVVQKPFIKD